VIENSVVKSLSRKQLLRLGSVSKLRSAANASKSPGSNGMAEAFVKTFKRDYVYLADLWDAETVLGLLPTWFADYNHNHPHKGLKMMSPTEFRRGLAV
jgi:putative transposase